MTNIFCHERDMRQDDVADWVRLCFGDEQATSSPKQRAVRLMEESIEAAQACGADKDMLHKLIDYVYSRPVGSISQELGGVGVTLLALASAVQFSAEACEYREVERILSKPPEMFTKRNAEKNAAGFQC